MSRSEEARKETKLDKDIPEDILFLIRCYLLLTIKFLIFFRQKQLPKISYQLAFYRMSCLYIFLKGL